MKIATQKKYQKIKFFSIDSEKNELRNFYHDTAPVLLLYSKRDLLNPKLYEEEIEIKKIKSFIKSKKNVVKQEYKGGFFDEGL